MVLKNIVDHRTNKYKWQKITAIIEPTCHDNSIKDADYANPPVIGVLGYEEFPTASVEGAIDIASRLGYDATVYLYDHGDGIRTARDRLIDRLKRNP